MDPSTFGLAKSPETFTEKSADPSPSTATPSALTINAASTPVPWIDTERGDGPTRPWADNIPCGKRTVLDLSDT